MHNPTDDDAPVIARHLWGEPLPDTLRNTLREYVRRVGETGASRYLDISRTTLARALAGLGLRRTTLACLAARLAKFEQPTTAESKGGTK